MSTGAEAGAYVLLNDGTTVEIRPSRPGDFDAVRDMHAKMSPDTREDEQQVAAEQAGRCVHAAP